MSSKVMEVSADYIKGAMVGALLGDCIGHVFEGETISKEEVQKYFKNLDNPEETVPVLPYSDDTAMLKSVAESLIQNQGFNAVDMAKKFTTEYFADPKRGYGQNIVEVFEKLKKDDFKNVNQPAAEQFDGKGSYGNGGAMRVAPVALFSHGNYENLLTVAKQTTVLTHTHNLAIYGAILQAVAVQQALLYDRSKPIEPKEFLKQLKEKFTEIETEKTEGESYVDKLDQIEKLLATDEVSEKEVVAVLGNGVAAFESVPTAIYVFLRALKPIADIETENVISRTIQYAIHLGGDTDTIATMAAAISGAYHGYEQFDHKYEKYAEKSDYIIELAQQLYDVIEKPVAAAEDKTDGEAMQVEETPKENGAAQNGSVEESPKKNGTAVEESPKENGVSQEKVESVKEKKVEEVVEKIVEEAAAKEEVTTAQ